MLATSLPGDAPGTFSALYGYAVIPSALGGNNDGGLHGSMVTMPHLAELAWDYADRLQFTSKSAGSGQLTYFTYDASGQRVRKVYEHSGIIEERIYLGGYEVYRRRAGSVSAPIHLERQTLHVMDDTRRVAMVETKTVDTGSFDSAPLNSPRWRYQLDNHLGSSALELDQAANVISYEEYHPYGSTAFHTASGAVSQKRYRYTGKEKDDETGLYYHGARYYAAWLGRWTAADPAGMVDGLNLYRYSRNNPIIFSDPGGTEASTFERILGGVKAVGGALETAAGVSLVLVGAATSEVGIGIAIAAAGVAVTAHGADTTVSGVRTAISGERTDTLTSQGLQAVGVERNTANLVDAGISVVGTLGAGAATRAPAVAGEAAVSFSPGIPVGHNAVRITTASGATQSSHLVIRSGAELSSGLPVAGTEALVVGRSSMPAMTASVPVTAARAESALATSQASVAARSAGEYGLTCNSCTTYAAGLLREAGVATLPVNTPATLFVTTALQSPGVVQPLAVAGATVNATVGVLEVSTSSSEVGQEQSLMSIDPGAFENTSGATSAEHSSLDHFGSELNVCAPTSQVLDESSRVMCY